MFFVVVLSHSNSGHVRNPSRFSRGPAYHILWLRGFRDHTISRRGFNLFKPLRRHFPATLAVNLSRSDLGDRNASVQTNDDQPRREGFRRRAFGHRGLPAGGVFMMAPDRDYFPVL